MSARSRTIALLVTAPILLLVGLLGTGYAWLSDGLTGQGAAVTAAQYGVALVIGASGAIALLVTSRRGEKSRVGTVVGAILTGVAVLVCGVPFVLSLGLVAHNAVLSARPPTAQETTSTSEMRERSTEFLDESVSVLGAVERDQQSSVYGCQLSNLDSGSQLSSFEVFSLPIADRDELLDAIAARWESLGYDVARSDDYLTIDNQGWIDTARTSWYADEGAVEGNLAIDVTTTCVVAD